MSQNCPSVQVTQTQLTLTLTPIIQPDARLAQDARSYSPIVVLEI